jgi:hypothetical protein
MRHPGGSAAEFGVRVSLEVRFWGVPPACFVKSGQGVANEWVAVVWDLRVCKELK